MRLKPVKNADGEPSENIARKGYDPTTQTLQVEFQNGAVGQYSDVPPSVNRDFDKADSKGKFLNSTLARKPAYPYEQLKPPRPKPTTQATKKAGR